MVGKIKDETASIPIKDYVGIKAKNILFLMEDSSEHKKAKGVNKMLLWKFIIMNIKMFGWTKYVCGIR